MAQKPSMTFVSSYTEETFTLRGKSYPGGFFVELENGKQLDGDSDEAHAYCCEALEQLLS